MRKTYTFAIIGSLLYLGFFSLILRNLQVQHLVILVIFHVMFFASSFSRRLICALSVFLVYLLIYDSLRLFPSDSLFAVNIKEPYLFEKSLFSINGMTYNEYFQVKNSAFIDVLCGFFYLSWVPGPIFYSLWLWYSGQKDLYLSFTYTFLLVNLIGFIIYYLYPAAPPWYVELYGFDYLPDVPPSQGRLIHFDDFFGIELFKGMYNENANKFAAIPSLHSAYPVVLLLHAGRRYKKLFIPCFVLMLGIWFSAVYLNHHYIIDVVLGASVSVIAYFLFPVLASRGVFRKFLLWHKSII